MIVRDAVLSNIDVTSLRVVNASHKYQLIVREKNIVEVAFPNIQLPDSNTNEAKSHGFVQLEFKPKAGLPVNAEINNSASIFFDYNAPIVTNTATTKIQIILGTASNRKLNFKLFPNPTSSSIKIGTKVKNIRLVPDAADGHDIECKIDGFGAMKLKSSVVKKA